MIAAISTSTLVHLLTHELSQQPPQEVDTHITPVLWMETPSYRKTKLSRVTEI